MRDQYLLTVKFNSQLTGYSLIKQATPLVQKWLIRCMWLPYTANILFGLGSVRAVDKSRDLCNLTFYTSRKKSMRNNVQLSWTSSFTTSYVLAFFCWTWVFLPLEVGALCIRISISLKCDLVFPRCILRGSDNRSHAAWNAAGKFDTEGECWIKSDWSNLTEVHNATWSDISLYGTTTVKLLFPKRHIKGHFHVIYRSTLTTIVVLVPDSEVVLFNDR